VIQDLVSTLDSWVLITGLVFLRMGGLMIGFPAFGDQAIPMRVRLCVALALTVLVTPMVDGQIQRPLGAAGAEICSGLLFGLILRMITQALLTTGAIIGNSTSLAQLFGAGMAEDPQPVMGRILYWSGLALLTFGALPERSVSFVILTYDLIPLGSIAAPSVIADAGVAAVAKTFALAFALAAPFVVAAFLYNVFLGVVSRAMPQLMVTLIGAPALTGGSILLLIFSIPVLLQVWVAAVHGVLATGAYP